MRKTFFAKYSLAILMAFCFATPLIFQGAQRAVRSNTNKVTDWLPKSFQETTELRWFRQHFVADQFVVVSWDGCTLGDGPGSEGGQEDDPRIERLAKFLAPKSKNVARAEGMEHTQYFQSVTTARRLLNQLTSEPSDVPYSEAKKRLQGTLIGPDGKQTCVVVMLSDLAVKNFRPIVGRSVPDGPMPWQRKLGVLCQVIQRCGIDIDTVRLGGPPIENVAIDEEGDRTLARLAGLSGILGLGLAWWSLRSIGMTLIVFACGVLSAAASMAVVFWTGQTSDAIMMSMPSMMYVLAISGAVHLVNYYREAVHASGLDGAPERAISHGWKPAFLCNVTTGIGLASLCAADLAPIRKFGIYSAVAVIFMLLFLFLFLPAALQLWPIHATRRKRTPQEHPDGQATIGQGTIWSEQSWSRFGSAIIRHHALVSAACFAFIAVAGLGLIRVHTNIDLLKLFDPSVRVRQDYVWFEKHLGRLVPLEVVVKFPAEKQRLSSQHVDATDATSKFSYLERLEFVSLIQQTIDRELGPRGRNMVGPSLSPVTFAPPLESGGDSWSFARRSATNKALEESQQSLAKSGYLHTDNTDDSELWRISLRAAAFEDLDYGKFVKDVRAAVEPVLSAQRLREAVLTQIGSIRTQGISGATVCLWERTTIKAPDARTTPLNAPICQRQMVTQATQELLTKARLKLTVANIDLPTLATTNRQAAIAHFKTFDCVVALSTTSNADIKTLQQAGVRVVDARPLMPSVHDGPTLATTANTPTVSAVYTGVVPIVYKAQRALLDNLMQSSFWSFVTITPLLMLVCRSVTAGAVVMLPNILPVLVIFGGMGWLGITIDIGSMMAASIALGVAVDDTIHYLTWYRLELQRLGDRKKAIIATYGHCGPPTLQAALISGLSLSVFAFSTFTPTQRMGWLMMSILIAGVIAELVMMPAILAGPLGRVFKVKSKPIVPPPIPAPHTRQESTTHSRVRRHRESA